MDFLATRHSWWLAQAEALLASQGIGSETRRDPGHPDILILDVAASDCGEATVLLSEQLGEALKQPPAMTAPRSRGPLARNPDFAAALALSGLWAVVFGVAGGSAARSLLWLAGALRRDAFFAGEWWRMVTASTLHADLAHLASNAGFGVMLGWGVAERIGAGFMVASWLITAVAGFGGSLLFGDASSTIGASGGLFGLLGLTSILGMRQVGSVWFGRRERLRLVGAGILLLAMTAFGPDSNLPAHLVGFAAGVLLGAVLPKEGPPRPWWQILMVTASATVVLGAWFLAT